MGIKKYSRQVLFKDIGVVGQKRLKEASAAIIGVGALGTVSSELLARAGIGKLILFDSDKVEKSNLQRQALYTEKDIGAQKVLAAKKHLKEINSDAKILAINERITKENIGKIKADVIIDGTDNLEARFLLNEYAKKRKIPFVYGSAAGSIGIVYNVLNEGACFFCIFKNAKNFATCHTEGILNSATYMTGSLQAAEALKIILGKSPEKDIQRFDVWKNTFERYRAKKDENCHVCNGNYTLLEGKNDDFLITDCKTKSAFVAKPRRRIRLDMKKITGSFDTIEDGKILAVIKVGGEEIIVHDYGELLFKKTRDIGKIRKIAGRIYKVAKILG